MLCLFVYGYDEHSIPQQQDTPTEPTPVQEPAYADAQSPSGGNGQVQFQPSLICVCTRLCMFVCRCYEHGLPWQQNAVDDFNNMQEPAYDDAQAVIITTITTKAQWLQWWSVGVGCCGRSLWSLLSVVVVVVVSSGRCCWQWSVIVVVVVGRCGWSLWSLLLVVKGAQKEVFYYIWKSFFLLILQLNKPARLINLLHINPELLSFICFVMLYMYMPFTHWQLCVKNPGRERIVYAYRQGIHVYSNSEQAWVDYAPF